MNKENSFGRRIFESFAGEFSVTHLNDKADAERQASPFPAHIEEAIEKNIRDYQASAENYGKMIDALDAQLAEAQAELAAVPERKTWIARLPV